MTEYREIRKPLEAWQNMPGVEIPPWVVILQHQTDGILLISTGTGPLDIEPTEWLVYRKPLNFAVEDEGTICKFTDEQFRDQFEPITPVITLEILTDAVLNGMGISRIDPRDIYQPVSEQQHRDLKEPPMMMIDGLDETMLAAEMAKPGHVEYRQAPIAEDDPRHPNQRATRFRDQLEHLINDHSMENGSNTPDFILAEFLTATLMAFDKAVSRRTEWYGGGEHKDIGGLKARIAELEAQLQAEGEHTAAGQAEIERLEGIITAAAPER